MASIKFPGTPGVKIQEISKFPPSVAAVATAIPAFIGYTEKAKMGLVDLILKPTKISSLLEYEQFYGTASKEAGIGVTITADGSVSAAFPAGVLPSPNNMYYSLQAYFANGGGPCYIVAVAEFDAPTKAQLKLGLDALANEDEPTLIVFPESQSLTVAEHGELVDDALRQCEDLQDRFVIADIHNNGLSITSSALLDAAAEEFRNNVPSNERLKYGAAYFPNVHTGFDYLYDDSGVTITGATVATLDALKTADGALYSKAKQAIGAIPVTLPPSPVIAGVYAYVDNTRGVWKAPANVGLSATSGLTFKVTEQLQENLNVHTTGKSINAIRAFTGKGILVWGARTLDGNSNEWRYVPVRRFFNMVEESTKKATGRFVFEPNDANTWVKVRAMIENFLLLQWRAGALQGGKPDQAFYVKVGLGETMTALDILEGRMIVEIGMAVVRPAEFIILKFSHKMPEA